MADEEFPNNSPSMSMDSTSSASEDTPMEEASSERAAHLISQLLDESAENSKESPTVMEELQTRGYQRKICEELLEILDSVWDSPPTGPNGTFIRTTLYTPEQMEQQKPSVREILGVTASTTSQLAGVLTNLLTHRVDREYLLPATQDVDANMEAMGIDPNGDAAASGGKAALTISSLGLTAARLYVALLGKKGSWGAGLVDVGGISAVSALVRRWCVECRGREPGSDNTRGSKGKTSSSKSRSKEPEKKKPKGTRKSVRINANATFMDSDSEGDGIGNEAYNNGDGTPPDLNATFFITEDSLDDKLTDSAMISGGISLAASLGQIALQNEYKNWSSEAREAYLDALCIALATTSALMQGGDADFVEECKAAVENLENAICTSISKPTESNYSLATIGSSKRSKKKSPKEERATEKCRKESAIYILRGLFPLLNIKVELPNGQAGKITAYEATTALLVRIISTLSDENRVKRVRLSVGSASSATPKRGGRKSISFTQSASHTPGKTPLATLQPPSLKKSITPRRTRSAVNQETAIQPLLSLVIGMLHKLFTAKGLERADARERVTNIGITCLTHLPSLERRHVLNFIGEMCASKVSSHRLLAVELIGDVLCTDWYWVDVASRKNKMVTPRASSVDEEDVSSLKLLTALHGRLTDKSPTVRMRAAMSLGMVVQKANSTRGSEASKALIDALCNAGATLVESLRHRACTDDKATVRKASIVAWLEMLSLAHRHGNEECAVSGLDISSLCSLCNDSSVATRKAAAEALTKLVQNNYDGADYTAQASALEMAWAHTVLPLVRDAELSCVSKSLEFFSSLVVNPIIDAGNAASDLLEQRNTQYVVAWRILSKITLGSQEAGGSRNGTGSLEVAIKKLFINAGNDCKALAKNLLQAVHHAASLSLGLDCRSSDSFVSQNSAAEVDLSSKTIHTTRAGSWCLLDALTGCLTSAGDNNTSASNYVSLNHAVRTSNIDSSFLALSLKKFRTLLNAPDVPFDKKTCLANASRDCLRVISKMASFVPIDDAKDCFKDLTLDLESFRMSIDLISVAVSALTALSKRLCDDSGEDVYDKCEQWINKLLTQCKHGMESSFTTIARHRNTEREEQRLTRILFMIGELSMVGFSSEDLPGNKIKKLATDQEPVRGLLVRPSAQLLQSVKLMLPNLMPVPGGADDALVPTTSSIRAHAFITLGKLCLRDEFLAKDSLNILARELHQNSTSDPTVKSNALMAMGDLCVRYTNLSDKYLPFMASCLQASEATFETGVDSRLSATFYESGERCNLVKKNAIMLLSSLVLQDYIKWRGLFVFRFLAAVADEDDEVACLARTAIRGPLLDKQPNLLATSFVESIFVFNSCKAHPIYAAAAANGGVGYAEIDIERGLLEGNDGYNKRHEVYQMMLDNMSDEQKLKVTVDIVNRILSGALDVKGDLGMVCRLAPNARAKISDVRLESATHVLRDAFAILPQIKVGRRATEDQEDDEFAEGNAARANQRIANKDRLLSKISVKHLVEIVIPVLCNLKSVLEGSRSALLRDLMKYLGYIFRSYKREVTEHLANDPTLLQELDYDMRQFEKKERESILDAEIVAVA